MPPDAIAQQAGPSRPDAAAAKLLLDERRSAARKPLAELQENFDQALERLSQSAQQKGELEALLDINSEREQFRKRAANPEPSSYAPLNELRQIYQRESAEVQKQIVTVDKKLLTAFVAEMEPLVTQFTRADELEKALGVRKQIDAAKKEIGRLAASGSVALTNRDNEELILGSGADYEKDPRVTVTERGDLYVLTSTAKDSTFVSGKKTFKAPFRIQARAMLESKSMRIYFAQRGMVVFNWEVRPTELRVIEPVGTKRNGLPGGSGLKEKQMYDFEIRVSKSDVSVYVDGAKRGEVQGDFSTANGKVGIGPNFGGAVAVEYLKAIQESE